MIRAIIFILLKITEVVAVIFGPYLLGSIYYSIIGREDTFFVTWMCGVGIIIIIAVCLIGVGAVISLICLNLDFSKKIAKKLKK